MDTDAVQDFQNILNRLEALELEQENLDERRRAAREQLQELLEAVPARERRSSRAAAQAADGGPPHRIPPPLNVNLPLNGIFRPGQVVFIENRITHVPIRRRGNQADRAAIVTRVTEEPDRVYFTTFNGYSSFCHPRNLRDVGIGEQLVLQRIAQPGLQDRFPGFEFVH